MSSPTQPAKRARIEPPQPGPAAGIFPPAAHGTAAAAVGFAGIQPGLAPQALFAPQAAAAVPSLAAPTNNEVKQQPVDGGFKFVDLNPVARKKNLMRNRIRILNYSRKSRENSGNGGAPEREKCNCKHSKCLKLYCECFRRGEYCEDCNCKCCQNRIEDEDVRREAVLSTLERNANAFRAKITPTAKEESGQSKGCRCTRSKCLKRYCECFQAGALCTDLCRCQGCKNTSDSKERAALVQLAKKNTASDNAQAQQDKAAQGAAVDAAVDVKHIPKSSRTYEYTYASVKMDDDDAEDAVAPGAAVAQAPVSEADAKIQAVCDNVLGEVAVQEAAKRMTGMVNEGSEQPFKEVERAVLKEVSGTLQTIIETLNGTHRSGNPEPVAAAVVDAAPPPVNEDGTEWRIARPSVARRLCD